MKSIGNWRTTVVGAVVGFLVYWQSIGAHVPRTPDEWSSLAIAAALALLGALVKDGATGSPPGARR